LLILDVVRATTRVERAVDAGAEVTMPLQKQFWGDRYGEVRGPFGVTWSLAAHDD